jgi:hypothetical protein
VMEGWGNEDAPKTPKKTSSSSIDALGRIRTCNVFINRAITYYKMKMINHDPRGQCFSCCFMDYTREVWGKRRHFNRKKKPQIDNRMPSVGFKPTTPSSTLRPIMRQRWSTLIHEGISSLVASWIICLWWKFEGMKTCQKETGKMLCPW